MSLKDAGVYHSIYRDTSGNYVVESEDAGWLSFLSLHQNFHVVAGDVTYAYSAIFSPALFSTDIIHEWQEYNNTTHQWTTVSRVDLTTVGGREGGYRTYSVKNNIAPGRWRVNVETAGGQSIGRLRFNVIAANTEPILKTEIKN